MRLTILKVEGDTSLAVICISRNHFVVLQQFYSLMWSLPGWCLPHFVLSVYQSNLVGVHAESCQATTMVTTMVTMHSSASYCQQVFPLGCRHWSDQMIVSGETCCAVIGRRVAASQPRTSCTYLRDDSTDGSTTPNTQFSCSGAWSQWYFPPCSNRALICILHFVLSCSGWEQDKLGQVMVWHTEFCDTICIDCCGDHEELQDPPVLMMQYGCRIHYSLLLMF